MGKILMTLGPAGALSDPADVLATQLAYCLKSDYSQSTVYATTITSIPYLIARYEKSPIRMVDELETALTTCFNRYYDSVEVTVTASNSDVVEYEITIYIRVIITGATHDIRYIGLVNNGVLGNITGD